jgi:hypothetical protein
MNFPDITTISAVSAALGCLFTFVQTIVVLAALLYASQQIKEARREQLLSAVWEIFNYIDTGETREARAFLYHNKKLFEELTDEKLKELPQETHDKVQLVSNTFDRLGYTVAQGLVPAELILNGYAPIIARCWLILEPYIQITRKLRAQNDYQKFFQYLGEMALSKYISPANALRQIYGTFKDDMGD